MRKFCLEYEGNDYLRPKVLVDDDIAQEVSAASAVGTPIKVDRQMSMATKGRFARVCVELNLKQPLVSKVFIGGAWRHVKYEGILGFNSGCGRVNHRIEHYMEVEDRVVLKVDKGLVGPSKRISSVSGAYGSKSILLVEMPVLAMIDNVGGGVVAKLVLNEPKPPDLIADDIIMCEKPVVLLETLANNVDCVVNNVVLSKTDDDISDSNGDCGGRYRGRSPPKS
ncbi:hypothetical protein K2173_006869 [Erythroxylum novogranatense]|uniref:Uncharacterized protein n=1 Tax=Erythroxylum novogranatense TaxID=1862640 RepID=A0AAV8SYY8_9ROSI|nr:hypothetical protein K2173_006869 [Erythroxylum novogranatense]